MRSKVLKTHAYSSKNEAKSSREEKKKEKNFSHQTGPALRKHVSHTPTQLRLARTHERIEIEIDFPVMRGVLKVLAPLNLR